MEARAAHLDRHPAAVAALVDLHVGDLEGQRLGLDLDVRLHGTGELAHQHVVGAGLRARHQRLLVRLQRRLEGRVVVRAVRQRVVTHEDLVRSRGLVGFHADAQRLAGADRDLEQPRLASQQRCFRRHAEGKFRHLDGDRIGRGTVVVVLVGGLVDLVEDVRAHDDPVLAVERRRDQHILQFGLVAGTDREPAAVRDAPEQAVRQVPVAVGGQVDRIAPASLRRVVATVRDRPAERDRAVDGATRRHRDIVDHQIRRRRQFDQQRLRRRARVVVLASGLEHCPVGAAPRDRIGHDEHVVVTVHAGREPDRPCLLVVAFARRQAAGMLYRTEVAVCVDVEELVGRQVDAIGPAALQRRCVTLATVLDPVRELEELAGEHPLGDVDVDHTQVRRGPQVHVQRGRSDVVALAAVLVDRVVGKLQRLDPGEIGDAATDHLAAHIGIGVDQHVVVAVDAFGQRESQRTIVARPDVEVAVARELAEQQVAGIQRRVLRQEHAVVPAPFARLPRTLVGDREARRDRAAGVGSLRIEHQTGDHQIRLAVDDVGDRDAGVVGESHRFPCVVRVVLERLRIAAPGVLRVGQAVPWIDVGEYVDVERSFHPGRQRDLGARGIALTGAQRSGVVVHHGADALRTPVIEGRIRRDPHAIQPVARATPDRPALVLDRPGDLGLLAREIRLGRDHLDHAQVRGRGRHVGGGGVRVVVLDGLGQCRRVVRVGDDGDVLAGHRGRQIETLLHRVATERRQVLRTLEAAQHPHLRARRRDVRHVRHVHGVEPRTARFALGAVLHRPAHRERRVRRTARIGLHLDHLQVRLQHHRADEVDAPGLVVVVVQFVRIVLVDPVREGVLEHRIVGVRPRRDVVHAGGDLLRHPHLHDHLVGLADGERALALERPQQDTAVAARVRTRLVAREPDRVAPLVGTGGVRATVRDRVAHLDLGAVDRLRGSYDVAGDQVRGRERIDVDRLRQRVVAVLRELVDGVVGVRAHDDETVAAEADRNLQRVGQRTVALVGIQRRSVGDAADQQVAGVQLRVERQVDVVLPLAGGRHRATVHDVEGDLDGRPGRRGRRHRDRLDLQVGPRVRRQRHRLVVGQHVVPRCVSVFVERTVGIGHHLDAPGSGEHGHREALGARVGQPRAESVGVCERAQRDRRRGRVTDLAQQHGIGPSAVGRCVALVRHRPRDLDRLALEALLRREDVGHDQVGTRRQRDRCRSGVARVVVRVDELERPAGGHEYVVIPGEPVRQCEQHAAVVAGAGGQRTEMVERPAAHHAAAVGVGREHHRVGPRQAVGARDADVVHPPAHCQRAAGLRARGRRGRTHLQVRVAVGHHVEHAGGAIGVVGLETVLEHHAVGVAAHEQRVAAGESRRQDQFLAARIALAYGEEAVAREAREHDVVAVAGDVVARGDDGIGPRPGQTGSGAFVGHRPADGDVGGIGDGLRGRADVRDHQVGVRRQCDRQRGGLLVVVLGTGLAHRVRRVAAHDDPPVAGQIDRQRDSQRTVVALARGQWPGVRDLAEQRVAAADHAVLRQVDAVDPAARGRTRTGVLHPPADGDRVGRTRGLRHRHRGDVEVRMAEEEGLRGARVVGLAAVLVDLRGGIGDDHDAVVAVGPVGQRDQRARLVAAAHRDLAPLRDGGEQQRTGQRTVHRQVDAVDPVAAG
ncbi:MAG: hypothetical protein CALGDGBN_01931 [Pseudomonadales bacterium]|nr:hypothetical protein [Pseudomonadales bacterium]